METATKPERREAICGAVFELLGEVGYDRMSMDAVAARARASKATIYRAWENKPELVMEALTQRFGGSAEAPDTGSLRGDLASQLTAVCTVANGDDGAIVMGLLTAASRDAELARTLHQVLYDMKHSVYETILARAVERGEVPASADAGLLHELIHAMMLTRRLWGTCALLDEAYVNRVIDKILLPVLRQDA
ncbi:TetR/AcrR family transcriptional regulator [Luedemannella helvata]|uniref:TetR/AcrR family transcriptional regulator n=1 Tax=Luedemannella helvata TaxID=349315 RepID=A0ABN2L1L2_9ACTN